MMTALLLEKFRAEHFEALRGEPSVAPLLGHLTSAHLSALESAPYAYSILRDSRVLVCAGVAEYWPGRGEAWAVLSTGLRHDLVRVTKMIRRFLEVCPVRRIEAAVSIEHDAGHRWARLVGFQLEVPLLKSYLPDGRDCSLYSRVRGVV